MNFSNPEPQSPVPCGWLNYLMYLIEIERFSQGIKRQKKKNCLYLLAG
jgi:hypothetical protein